MNKVYRDVVFDSKKITTIDPLSTSQNAHR